MVCRNTTGFTAIELLIVITIISILTVASVGYYQDYTDDAKHAVAITNLKIVNEAVARYFKDRMMYPTSLESLEGAFLVQSVEEIFMELDRSKKVYVWVAKSRLPTGMSLHNLRTEEKEWIEYKFASHDRGQIARVDLR